LQKLTRLHGLVPEQLVQFSLFCYDFADVRVE
jgi:hypothetical protein